MKCTRCAAEVPGQAQFCMRCGTPVNVGRPAGPMAAAVPAVQYSSGTRPRSKAPAILAAIALLAVVAILIALKLRPNAKVTDVNARPLNPGNLTDTGARIKDTAPLAASNAKINPGPADPVEVIDYLKHVKETERQRLALSKQQLAALMTQGTQLQGANLLREMNENPEEGHKKDYSAFQQSISQWSTQWEELSRGFNAYPKPVPQSCTLLRDKYLDALGKTSATMTTVGNSLAQALGGGDPGKALELLTPLQGSASADIDQACSAADREVAAICEKYHITKDFDIKSDGGASNPFGVGR